MPSQPAEQREPRNLLLAALPDREMQIFRDSGQKISLHEGKILQTASMDEEWLFFPTSAVLSLIAMTKDGLSVETGLVGHEGLVDFQR